VGVGGTGPELSTYFTPFTSFAYDSKRRFHLLSSDSPDDTALRAVFVTAAAAPETDDGFASSQCRAGKRRGRPVPGIIFAAGVLELLSISRDFTPQQSESMHS
jgi:hypothetical protein